MSITRAEVEQIITKRLGAFLVEAGMDTLQGGINPWLTDPMRWALYMLGIETASVISVDNADLTAVQRHQVDALLDLCELKTLETISTNYTDVDTKVGAVYEYRAALGTQIRQIADRKRTQIISLYGELLAQPLEPVSSTGVRLVAL